MSEILDVFNDESAAVESEAQEVEVSTEEASNEVTEDTTEQTEEKPEEPESEPTSDEEKAEKENWTLAAVKDERAKRQEAVKRAEELEAKLNELESGSKEKKETPDIFDDQEGYTKSLKEDFNQSLAQAKFDLSVELMKEVHSDFDEVTTLFVEAAKANPVLKAEALKAANPAKFAYEQGKKYAQYKEMQDVDSYKASLRAELEKEVRAEFEAKQKQSREQEESLSPSLAKARGSKEQNESIPENPADLF